MIEKIKDVSEFYNQEGYLSGKLIANKLNELIDWANKQGVQGCPPHNFVPHNFVGSWGGSQPPPNMKCTKCLMESYF